MTKDPQSRVRITTILSRLLRLLIFVVLTIAVLVFVAIKLYSRVEDQGLRQWIAMASTGVTIGFVVYSGMDLLKALSYLVKAVWARGEGVFREGLKKLQPHVVPLVFFSLTLPTIIAQVEDTMRDSEPDPKPAVFSEGSFQRFQEEVLQAMVRGGYTRQRATFLDRLGTDYYFARFPILFVAGTPAGDVESGFEATEVEFQEGADYDADANGDLVARVVEALIPCGAGDGSRPVRLRVEGYASSAPFSGFDEVESLRLNVLLANERRRAVADALEAEISRREAETRVEVLEAPDYGRIEEMERDREFNDRPNGTTAGEGGMAQDLLTRAAHIKVLDPARCAVR